MRPSLLRRRVRLRHSPNAGRAMAPNAPALRSRLARRVSLVPAQIRLSTCPLITREAFRVMLTEYWIDRKFGVDEFGIRSKEARFSRRPGHTKTRNTHEQWMLVISSPLSDFLAL